MNATVIRCEFCDRAAIRMIEGQSDGRRARICAECVQQCVEILLTEKQRKSEAEQ